VLLVYFNSEPNTTRLFFASIEREIISGNPELRRRNVKEHSLQAKPGRVKVLGEMQSYYQRQLVQEAVMKHLKCYAEPLKYISKQSVV